MVTITLAMKSVELYALNNGDKLIKSIYCHTVHILYYFINLTIASGAIRIG